ncbi:MAG TPA: alpha/beta hydrolase [Microthrixaceae bacterium]|nr:alpha/beta hydrolase [Microthrixaceae bacterium]
MPTSTDSAATSSSVSASCAGSAASTDGVTCSYLRLGGRGPRVLLVHATGFCATVWRPFAEALSDRFECWALDVRSHGLSTTAEDGRFEWEATGHDVLAVIEAIDEREGPSPSGWRGVGHSMGAAALLLAEQYRPGTFEAMWLYEPIVFATSLRAQFPEVTDNPLAQGAERRRETFDTRQAALDNFTSKAPMNVFAPGVVEGYLERGFVPVDPADPSGALTLACDRDIEAQIYRSGHLHHAWEGLGSVHCPVMVAGGPPDSDGPAALASMIAEELPAGRWSRHDELAHFGPFEAPAATAAEAAAFFGEEVPR